MAIPRKANLFGYSLGSMTFCSNMSLIEFTGHVCTPAVSGPPGERRSLSQNDLMVFMRQVENDFGRSQDPSSNIGLQRGYNDHG